MAISSRPLLTAHHNGVLPQSQSTPLPLLGFRRGRAGTSQRPGPPPRLPRRVEGSTRDPTRSQESTLSVGAWIFRVSPPPQGLISNWSTPLCPNPKMGTVSNTAAVVLSPGLHALRYRPPLSAWLMEAPGEEKFSQGVSYTASPQDPSLCLLKACPALKGHHQCRQWQLAISTTHPKMNHGAQFPSSLKLVVIDHDQKESHQGRGKHPPTKK